MVALKYYCKQCFFYDSQKKLCLILSPPLTFFYIWTQNLWVRIHSCSFSLILFRAHMKYLIINRISIDVFLTVMNVCSVEIHKQQLMQKKSGQLSSLEGLCFNLLYVCFVAICWEELFFAWLDLFFLCAAEVFCNKTVSISNRMCAFSFFQLGIFL